MPFPDPPPPVDPGDGSTLADQDPVRTPRSAPAKGVRVWLIRHGAVECPGVAYGNRDVPLSADGVRETQAAGQSMRGSAVYSVTSSPLSRARAMGEVISEQTGAPLSFDDRLKEVHRGDWQDLPLAEYDARLARDARAYWASPLHWRGYGGESEQQLADRTWPALIEAVEAAPAESTIVLTAHRQVIRSLVAAALGIRVPRSFAMTLDTAHGVELVAATSGEWLLRRTNAARLAAPQAADPTDGTPEDVPVSAGTPVRSPEVPPLGGPPISR